VVDHGEGGLVSPEEQTYKELVDELPDLVCRFTLDGTLLYVNKAYADYFGSTPEALVGTNYLDLVPDETRAEAAVALAAVVRLTPEHPVRVAEHRGGDSGDVQRWQQWVDKAVFDERGRVVGAIAVGRDVTERRRADAQLAYHARHDPLTGLVNRRCTIEFLEEAAQRSERDGSFLGMLYVDLDGFKVVNDRFGHREGDQLLVDVARALAGLAERCDLVGRVGGDEFVVVCTRGDRHVLDALVAAVAARLVALGHPMTASVGVVVHTPGESVDELMHRADVAMYATKAERRAAASA
jgi:diguanylate cyclase (GGDEF)-like protein/PAS domain S-box-containing protein